MKSILVPMGNTEHSREALKVAVKLAEKSGAVIRGIHVSDLRKSRDEYKNAMPYPTISPDLNQSIMDKRMESIVTEMDEEIESVRDIFQEITQGFEGKTEFIFKTGDLGEIVLEEEKSVDLIIMGKSREAENPKTPVLSPYARTIIQKSYRSALVISSGHEPGDRILLAYGGSPTSGKALIETAIFATLLGAKKIFALCVNEDFENASPMLEIVEKYLKPYDIEVEKIWKKTSVSEGIISTVQDHEINLLIMGAYGHESWKEFIFGSNTEKVIQKLDIPMLLCS